jgi:hypothetical protein
LVAKLAISTKNNHDLCVLSRDFADYDTISANFDNCGSFAHPLSHVLTHSLLKGEPEGAVTSVATFMCQLLGSEGTVCSNNLRIEVDEMLDAQIVDIGIVSRAQTREILAEIETVGTYCFGKLEKRQIML